MQYKYKQTSVMNIETASNTMVIIYYMDDNLTPEHRDSHRTEYYSHIHGRQKKTIVRPLHNLLLFYLMIRPLHNLIDPFYLYS